LLQVTDSFGSFPTDAGEFFKQLVSGFSVTASLVCDEQGNTISTTGDSKGLGNATDLALLIALRRQSQVILTSGRTFRNDQYKFPKQSDLAVLTTNNLEVEVPVGRNLVLLREGYAQAIADLRFRGYSGIHVEYGLTGITELLAQQKLDALLLSSKSRTGLTYLANALNLTPVVIELSDLYVGLVAWQPRRIAS
jgi:hypothetical protein